MVRKCLGEFGFAIISKPVLFAIVSIIKTSTFIRIRVKPTPKSLRGG